MPKVAIIGAGFSGLALCYHLLQKSYQVSLFDPKGIGGGTSGIASGLVHPYPGENGKMSWNGKEAMKETKHLIALAEKHLGTKVANRNGILRLALTPKQEAHFSQRAREEEEVKWWDGSRCQEEAKGIHTVPGMWISSGYTVHTKLYLKGLAELCQKLNAKFYQQQIELSDLRGYDHIVIAAGSGIRHFKECQSLPVKFNKGQLLYCRKPSYFHSNMSLIGKGYLALSENQDHCVIGSTYEHQFLTESPCMGTATDEIFSRVGQFLPSYGNFSILDCLSGVRVGNQRAYLPLLGRLKEGLWVVTAMGSRGLLYHGLMGKILAEAIYRNDDEEIPKEVAI
jgi:glycine/D-amino acid oxidase-like deaminating enzyme